MSVYLPFLILSLFCTWSCRLWMTTTLLEVDFGSYPWLISSLRLVFSLFVQHVPQHLSCFLRWVRATASYHPHCSASSLSAWVSSLIPVSLRDWPGIGSDQVRGSQARTWTCTLRFGSRTCRTWTHTKCSGSECSVRVHTMFEVKKSLNLANLSTTHRYYESKFTLDSFLFWVFPARFLRWLAANVNLLPRSRVCSCDLFGLDTVRFFKWLATIVNLFTWSHDFLLLKLWKGRTSSKCPSCHPAQPVPKSFYIL